jgi:hypothetical protein
MTWSWGLLEEWAERLGHVGQSQCSCFGYPVPVPLQLPFFEFQVCLQGGRRVGAIARRRHLDRWGAAEEVDLGGKDLRVLQLLRQMAAQFLGDGPVFRGGAFGYLGRPRKIPPAWALSGDAYPGRVLVPSPTNQS